MPCLLVVAVNGSIDILRCSLANQICRNLIKEWNYIETKLRWLKHLEHSFQNGWCSDETDTMFVHYIYILQAIQRSHVYLIVYDRRKGFKGRAVKSHELINECKDANISCLYSCPDRMTKVPLPFNVSNKNIVIMLQQRQITTVKTNSRCWSNDQRNAIKQHIKF